MAKTKGDEKALEIPSKTAVIQQFGNYNKIRLLHFPSPRVSFSYVCNLLRDLKTNFVTKITKSWHMLVR